MSSLFKAYIFLIGKGLYGIFCFQNENSEMVFTEGKKLSPRFKLHNTLLSGKMHRCRWAKPIRTENGHEARTESWKLPSVSHVTPLWIEGRPSRVIGKNLEGRVEVLPIYQWEWRFYIF